jgi:hypothetical protein
MMQYGAQTTFLCHRDQVRVIQSLVKKHDCRFVGNPCIPTNPKCRAMITVGTDDMQAFKAFQADADAIIHPRPATKPTKPALFKRLSAFVFGK